MKDLKKIYTAEDIIERVNELGMLIFWAEDALSAWTLSGVNFNKLWGLREEAVNSKKVVYGKFAMKKATFVSLEAFPYLCALRRDGYDFDSLADEGLAPNRECLIMNAVKESGTPSYELGKSLGIKGYDAAVTSLQNKTYLCLQFKKSYMGTALLHKPEDVFGFDFVRSAYGLSAQENIDALEKLCPSISSLPEKEQTKFLSKGV